MNGTIVPAVAAIAALNVVALLALVLAGREGWRRRRAAAASPAPPILAPGSAAAALEGDPLEALVSEVEEAESVARGEAKLAEDIARWRRRAAGGGELPGAATSGRRAAASVA